MNPGQKTSHSYLCNKKKNQLIFRLSEIYVNKMSLEKSIYN